MTDILLYDLIRGHLLKLSVYAFFIGIAYRFFRVLFLGLPPDYAPPKGKPILKAIEKVLLKPSQAWRFFLEVFAHRGIQYVGGFLFHLGFLGLTFFVPQHAFLWGDILGFEPPYLPQVVADILAYSALGSLFALTVHRIFNPVLRLLTGKDEYLANFLIGLVLFSGLLATRWAGGAYYLWMLNVHMLSACVLILYIPFSRLSHFVYYFMSVFFYGRNVGKRGVSF
ncbi:hypothetical protein Thal_1418 [Thermocrinis albus DSM 14484]|uniref:Nitrate reductase gamma subunit n=1 Tax=Thermocrinis albus (strain DSM 14484 / JCM 11386 / HI 11/12) TaxID=638303 RepID=D3SMR7_THEAH|nr:hypothetical protein [Thermocrinis albus]ADC90047.1 hypothetical protein Thal_1418 [Thermocrinis albus DSM 14484]